MFFTPLAERLNAGVHHAIQRSVLHGRRMVQNIGPANELIMKGVGGGGGGGGVTPSRPARGYGEAL